MAGFWEALESTTKTEADFSKDRQRRYKEAESKALAFYERMRQDEQRLQKFNINITIKDYTVSFRRNHLEMLAVTFGSSDGSENRIFSPVIEYLKLTPSHQDLKSDQQIDGVAGAWLGRSIEAVEKNRDMFAALGLI